MQTRGRRGRVLAAAAMVLALAGGCSSLPAGVDGRLADGWAALPPAQQFPPKAGDCHSYVYEDQSLTILPDDPKPCDGPHIRETVYVGTFTGAAAQLAEPPKLGEKPSAAVAKAQSDAYLNCNDEATRYLGHAWFDPRLQLHVTLPVDGAWKAGVRWYRCDLEQVRYPHDGDLSAGQIVERKASLRKDWPVPLCVEMNKEGWPERACTAKHSGEFTGAFIMPLRTTKPVSDKDYAPLHAKCLKLVSSYTGVSVSRINWGDGVFWQDDVAYWQSGRRVMWCFVWSGEKSTFTKSLKRRA